MVESMEKCVIKNNFLFFSFLFFHVDMVCVSVSVCVCVYRCTHHLGVQRPEVDVGMSSFLTLHLDFETGSPTDP